MEIRVNIPKIIKKDKPQPVKQEDIVENRFYNENGEWMEIINSAEFHRYNIKFSNIPSAIIIEILKAASWQYSPSKKIWYPHGNDAAKISHNFAIQIQKAYYKKQ